MADDGALPDPEPPAPTDERLPLNKRQVFKLQKSWKGIKRNMAATGLEMFVSMFRAGEDTKALFDKFRHIENEVDLRTSDTLEAHGSKVMDVIDDVITNIENVDYILSRLEEVGAMHLQYSGFTAEFFWRIEEPFLKAVKLTLGDRYTDNMDCIYKIVIKLILKELTKGAEGGLSNDIPNGENADTTNKSQNRVNANKTPSDHSNKQKANADCSGRQKINTANERNDQKIKANSS